MAAGSNCVWRCVLARWQGTHSLAQAVTSFARPAHTQRAATKRAVARLPGCPTSWTVVKTARLRLVGTSGRDLAVDTSHRIWAPLIADKITRRAVTERRRCTSAQAAWAAANSNQVQGTVTTGTRQTGTDVGLPVSGPWAVLTLPRG